MADLLETSARFIDNDIYEGAGLINRPTTELSEVGDGIALVEAFSHVVTFRTGDGLVLFDTSLEAFADGVKKSLRRWTDEPVSNICYTHGHADHVGGTGCFLCEAQENKAKKPRVIGHENTLRLWARANDCSQMSATAPLPDTARDGMRSTETVFDCPADTAVIGITVEGGDHSWPGGSRGPIARMLLGPVTRDFSANRIIWNFFKPRARAQ